MSILDQIVAAKRNALKEAKGRLPQAELEARISELPPPRDFAGALRRAGSASSPQAQGGGSLAQGAILSSSKDKRPPTDRVRLIAEVKQASPSRGLLAPDLDPVALAQTYAQNGAAAISVLTEERFFLGSLDYLSAIRQVVELPLLRKDFLFDSYQVYEARAFGADAILLIVAILSDEQLQEMLALSDSLGLACLVEVHDEDEVAQALAAGANIIGVNNRDLRTFHTDLATTQRLRPLIPQECILVSESGIKDKADLERLARWGVDAMLIGEALVTAKEVAAKVREFAS